MCSHQMLSPLKRKYQLHNLMMTTLLEGEMYKADNQTVLICSSCLFLMNPCGAILLEPKGPEMAPKLSWSSRNKLKAYLLKWQDAQKPTHQMTLPDTLAWVATPLTSTLHITRKDTMNLLTCVNPSSRPIKLKTSYMGSLTPDSRLPIP